jgi:hypothetical protein
MCFYFTRFRGQETIEEHRGSIEHLVEWGYTKHYVVLRK